MGDPTDVKHSRGVTLASMRALRVSCACLITFLYIDIDLKYLSHTHYTTDLHSQCAMPTQDIAWDEAEWTWRDPHTSSFYIRPVYKKNCRSPGPVTKAESYFLRCSVFSVRAELAECTAFALASIAVGRLFSHQNRHISTLLSSG